MKKNYTKTGGQGKSVRKRTVFGHGAHSPLAKTPGSAQRGWSKGGGRQSPSLPTRSVFGHGTHSTLAKTPEAHKEAGRKGEADKVPVCRLVRWRSKAGRLGFLGLPPACEVIVRFRGRGQGAWGPWAKRRRRGGGGGWGRGLGHRREGGGGRGGRSLNHRPTRTARLPTCSTILGVGNPHLALL
jgi:hypothetical protein